MAISDQKPLGNGPGPKATALELLDGVDLSGCEVIVTGGYSGIGMQTVLALASAGARITVPARQAGLAQARLEGIAGISIARMDLSDPASVRRFADDYRSSGRKLDLLVNNAGVMACPLHRTAAGWESQFAINHLGHFLLFDGLLPVLRAAGRARVIALSSAAHVMSGINWQDPVYEERPYDKWEAYGQSKSANALFALAVDLRERDNGIRAFSVHPGGIFTGLQRHLPEDEIIALGWRNADGTIPAAIAALFKTPAQGASTTVWAATSPDLEGKGGVYCEDCDIAPPGGPGSQRWEHAREWICDDAAARRLWSLSETMIGNA